MDEFDKLTTLISDQTRKFKAKSPGGLTQDEQAALGAAVLGLAILKRLVVAVETIATNSGRDRI